MGMWENFVAAVKSSESRLNSQYYEYYKPYPFSEERRNHDMKLWVQEVYHLPDSLSLPLTQRRNFYMAF